MTREDKGNCIMIAEFMGAKIKGISYNGSGLYAAPCRNLNINHCC